MKVGQNHATIPDSFYQTDEKQLIESTKTEPAKSSESQKSFSEMTERLVPSQKTHTLPDMRKSEVLIDGQVRAAQLQSSLLDQAKDKAQEIGNEALDGARNLKETGEKLVESGELYRPINLKDVQEITGKADADFDGHKVDTANDVKLDYRNEISQVKDGERTPVTNNQATPAPSKQDSADSKEMIKLMTNHGMKDVSNPPTDAQLRDYYRNYAPAHDLIAHGDYRAAAAEYKDLKNVEPLLFSTHEKTEQQLNFVATMKEAGVKNLQFPPSQQNMKDYFKTIGNKKNPPLSNRAILNEFEKYVKTFYNHEGRDIKYREKNKHFGGQTITAKAPESWSEISDERHLYPQGTRKIDCEGYTYLAKELLGQAGFKNGKFVVVGPKDDPRTPKIEADDAHVMFTAERNNEVAVVSNDRVLDGPRHKRSELLDAGYPKARGGLRAEDPVAWQATRKYEELDPSGVK